MRKLLGKELVEAGAVGLPAVLLLLVFQVGVGARVALIEGQFNCRGAGWWLPGLLAAMGIGLMQTLGEAQQGTWLWLFTRPIRRGRLLAAKALAGVGWSLLAGWLPLLAAQWLASRPGMMAAPFDPLEWVGWHRGVALLPLVWVGTLLGGMQGARPLWERLLTAVGTLVLAGLLVSAGWSPAVTHGVAWTLSAVLFVTAWWQRPELP